MTKLLYFRTPSSATAPQSSAASPSATNPTERSSPHPLFVRGRAFVARAFGRLFSVISQACLVTFVLALFVAAGVMVFMYASICAIASVAKRARDLWNEEWQAWTTSTPSRTCQGCGTLHEGFHRCPNRVIGFCSTCGRKRFLNRIGECPSGHDDITQIQLRREERMKKTLIL